MSQHDAPIARTNSDGLESQKSKVSVIEKSVTHLLVATKELLETLAKWARQEASETQVSDVYVRLGYEFNIACRAFKSVGVETHDLGPVPDQLRGILEETLSGDPSQKHLDKYLPSIRDIIVNLLHGLKRKQQKLRASVQRSEKDGISASSASTGSKARQSSSISTLSSTASDAGYARQASRSSEPRRQGSSDITSDAERDFVRVSSAPSQKTVPQRTSSGRSKQPTQPPVGEGTQTRPHESPIPQDQIPPTLKPPPYPPDSRTPDTSSQETAQQVNGEVDSPRFQPKAGDALAKLQRGGELERRASRRFSQYHIQKHLGSSTSGIPMMPPPQNSPIPYRGRDLKDGMNAVRNRSAQVDKRGTSKNKYVLDASPTRQQPKQDRIVEEESTLSSDAPTFELPAHQSPQRSPIAQTPEDKLGSSYFGSQDQASRHEVEKRQTREVPPERVNSPSQNSLEARLDRGGSSASVIRQPVPRYNSPTPESKTDLSSSGSSPVKELTLFLQYKTRIKKFVLAEGSDELSIPRLQLAFIEKFAWNTQSNGADLPEIYIQDPVSGVRHELEDLQDVKNRSVLVLNVDAVDEVKKHVDDGLGRLKSLLEGLQTTISDQGSVLKKVADTQQESAKELTRVANQPPAAQPATSSIPGKPTVAARGGAPTRVPELQNLRRDLAVLRQTHTAWMSDMKTSITAVRMKADTVKDLASRPQLKTAGDNAASAGRSYVLSSRKNLNSTTESIVSKVDELQDTVEDLRKDVVTRGVRPLPRQLESINKDMANASRDLKKLKDFMTKEKPSWQKVWRQELQTVYDEQNELTYQEELTNDLEGDLEAANETFKLVEEACKQQNLANGDGKAGPATGSGPGGSGSRNTSRTLNIATTSNPLLAKDSVLGEVKALQPNHESRLEAIERAERNRRRELEERSGGEFKRELGNFVDEGKLKKSGGFEEAERMRKQKDDRMRRLAWENKHGGPAAKGRESPITKADSPQERSSIDGAESNSSASDGGVGAAMQDLSSLAGSGLPPETGGSDKDTAAFAEAAKVPEPLEVPNGQDLRTGAMTPEPEFVEANEQPQPPP